SGRASEPAPAGGELASSRQAIRGLHLQQKALPLHILSEKSAALPIQPIRPLSSQASLRGFCDDRSALQIKGRGREFACRREPLVACRPCSPRLQPGVRRRDRVPHSPLCRSPDWSRPTTPATFLLRKLTPPARAVPPVSGCRRISCCGGSATAGC